MPVFPGAGTKKGSGRCHQKQGHCALPGAFRLDALGWPVSQQNVSPFLPHHAPLISLFTAVSCYPPPPQHTPSPRAPAEALALISCPQLQNSAPPCSPWGSLAYQPCPRYHDWPTYSTERHCSLLDARRSVSCTPSSPVCHPQLPT